MNKIDKLIKEAKKMVPIKPSIDFQQATMSELLDLINESTSKERFHEIVTALVYRCGSEVPYGE